MCPTTEPAIRIARLFNRRTTTSWSEKEVRQYRKLVKHGCFTTLDDLEVIERYYFVERKKENGIHRRDLYTFLNNFSGELDRARAWEQKNKKKIAPRYVQTNGARPVSDQEFQRIGELARQELERFKNSLNHKI